LAAIVLLLIKPTGLFEPGWQLSFAAVLGVLLLARPIESFFPEKFPRWLSSEFAVSLSAWLAVAGIILYHFYTIQWLTSIWTVLVSPLIGVVSILGYLKLFITLLSPSVGAILGFIVNVLADLLIYIVKLIADLNISEILIGKTTTWAIILYYALIIYSFFFHLRQRVIKKVVYTTATVTLVVVVALPGWQSAYREDLIVTVLDVGHGQAVLAELPNKTNILFDAGSLSRDDIGTRVVLPFLRYKGIGKIDSVVISHPDIDHINGIPEVNDNCPVESFYANKAFKQENKPTVKFLESLIKVKDINAIPATYGPATIKVLWPDREIYENNQIGPNDKSLVIMIEYAGRRVLICSDIEKFAQKEILRLYSDLRIDVIIAPHHGSTKTSERNFLEKLRPEVVVSSCTRAAYKKGQVIKEIEFLNSYYTGTHGAVTFRIDKNGAIKVSKFTK
jgi:competence protein ComEC